MALLSVNFLRRISKNGISFRSIQATQLVNRNNLSIIRNNSTLIRKNQALFEDFRLKKINTISVVRYLSVQKLSKNLTLVTDEPKQLQFDKKTLKLEVQRKKPLAFIVSWLLAKDQHLLKFAELYRDQGFDVLIARITPWELMFPLRGAHLAVRDIMKFLHQNDGYSTIVLHGFSVGGFVWCEAMNFMKLEMEKYQPVCDRFRAQIWDSLVGSQEMPVGVAYTFFPRNLPMRWFVQATLELHVRINKKNASFYYDRSIPTFHKTLVTAPALFLVSKSDVLGAEKLSLLFLDSWPKRDMKVTFKAWDNTAHVGLFAKHRNEYLQLLSDHLKSVGLLRNPEKIPFRD